MMIWAGIIAAVVIGSVVYLGNRNEDAGRNLGARWAGAATAAALSMVMPVIILIRRSLSRFEAHASGDFITLVYLKTADAKRFMELNKAEVNTRNDEERANG